jgi:hypothetical protein
VAIVFNQGAHGNQTNMAEYACYLGTSSTERHERADDVILHAAARGLKLTEREAKLILAIRHSEARDILDTIDYRR